MYILRLRHAHTYLYTYSLWFMYVSFFQDNSINSKKNKITIIN